MTYLITGAAGFIGYHLSARLLEKGEKVIGIDNLNDYYSPDLKLARLERLKVHEDFTFGEVDIADDAALEAFLDGKHYTKIIHLAAQAGVRYSIQNPRAYVKSNVVGHVNILEIARNNKDLEHMLYASSSSIYGGRTDLPFREDDRADTPVSLYAATKKADELMSHTYAHLYDIPLTGLRFFTVYGPFGRPDMAYFSFTRNILSGNEIQVFNHGEMLRDFTYIDDIVSGVLAIAEKGHSVKEGVPHVVYNIGNNNPEKLEDFIAILEDELGVRANRVNLDMQPGDVPATYADISAINRDYGFQPETDLRSGLKSFVRWYRQFYGE
ncbi:MAG: NAD-dependent epimerase/dehydratase family protein [Pseudomonadota bacterium]